LRNWDMLVLLLRTARLTDGLRGLRPELDRADYPFWRSIHINTEELKRVARESA